MPDLPGLEFAVNYRPCGQVGGDFYDAIRIDDTRILFVVGDVTGKGVPAALYGAFAGELVRSRTFRRRHTTRAAPQQARLTTCVCSQFVPSSVPNLQVVFKKKLRHLRISIDEVHAEEDLILPFLPRMATCE